MMREERNIYRLVSLAANGVLLCLLIEYICVNAHSLGTSFIVYLLAAGLYLRIINCPDKQSASVRVLMRNFILACLGSGYIYYVAHDGNAILLFYLLVVREALAIGRRCTHMIFLLVVVEFVVIEIVTLPVFTANKLVFLAVHSMFLFIAGLLSREMKEIFLHERMKSRRIEDLLHQMEDSYREAANSAQRDGLTGLYNHREFFKALAINQFSRVAVIMLDIDYFKQFNDIYGHLCGDYVLKELAEVLCINVRSRDCVYRYGGEEFAIIVKNMSVDELSAVALRIRRNVERHPFVYEGEKLKPITVSIGYAVYDAKELKQFDYNELVRQADECLYMAKKNGRNMVCSDGQIVESTS